MDRETSSVQKRYAHQVLNIEDLPTQSMKGEIETLEVEIYFSQKDATCINPHNDDPMDITVRCDDREIKSVLVDQRSFAYIISFHSPTTKHFFFQNMLGNSLVTPQ